MAERPSYAVRRARGEDIPDAVGLFEELDRFQSSWRVFEPRPNLSSETEARYRSALDPQGFQIHVVAERDGRLIGTAFARVHAVSSMSDELAAELANLVVAPDMRRQGVGRALVAEVARWARRKGAHRVVVKTYSKNAPARLFWEDLGFAPRLVQMTAPVEDLARGEA